MSNLEMINKVCKVMHQNIPRLIYHAYFWAEKRISLTGIRGIIHNLEYRDKIPEPVEDYCIDVLAGRIKLPSENETQFVIVDDYEPETDDAYHQ